MYSESFWTSFKSDIASFDIYPLYLFLVRYFSIRHYSIRHYFLRIVCLSTFVHSTLVLRHLSIRHSPFSAFFPFDIFPFDISTAHQLFPRLKGGSYEIKVCLFVCLFVCSLDWKEGLTKLKFVCLFVCLSVCHRVKRTLPATTRILRCVDAVRGNRCGELESEARFPRMTMVARQQIHRDFTGMGFPGGFQTWGIQIGGPFASDENGCSATDTSGFHR